MSELPTLYKRDSGGQLQEWSIHVKGSTFYTRHGKVGGKIQETPPTQCHSKNHGKANETTPEEQARLEAAARHEKQLKKGYVTTREAALAGEVDDVIEGGYSPMLALTELWPKMKHRMPPGRRFTQPKLDGLRCCAVVKDGVATLWSRTRKRIMSMPHIERALERMCPKVGTFELDGEGYADAYAHDFEKLMSVARKNKPDPEGLHLQIQYWIYDYPSVKANFGQRSAALAELMSVPHDECLVYVPTTEVSSDEEIEAEYAKHLEEGYEGLMVRADAPYEPSNGSYRSAHIQKRKPSEDAEFPIVGAEEGKGKDAGTVGAFVCDSGVCRDCEGAGRGYDPSHGATRMCKGCSGSGRSKFSCRLKASYARRRELHEHPELWRGKKMTVIYQKLSAYGVPMFPRGKAIREPE